MLQDPVLVSELPVRELLQDPVLFSELPVREVLFAARPCFSQRTSGQSYQAYALTSLWSMSEQRFNPVQDASMRSGMAVSDLHRL